MKSLIQLEVVAIPSDFSQRKLVDSMLGAQFLLCHSLRDSRTFILSDVEEAWSRLGLGIPGLKLVRSGHVIPGLTNFVYMTGVIGGTSDKKDENVSVLKDVYDIFKGSDSTLLVSFAPIDPSAVKEVRRRVEDAASKKRLRLTKSFSSKGGASNSSDSVQMELFYGSGEQRLLLSLIGMLNDIPLNNRACYKVAFIASGTSADKIADYVKSRVLILEERHLNETTAERLYDFTRKSDAVPFPYGIASRLIEFSGTVGTEMLIGGSYRHTAGTIEVGEYLTGSVSASHEKVRLEGSVFNLGTVISGVPGTGKTTAAMNLMSGIRKASGSRIVVISPTGEWNLLGRELGARVIRLYSSEERFNLFRCDSGINIEKFYENLAMLLASASNVGPYKNSMEKSLLYAFQKAYSSTRAPDPVGLYAEIENAVVEQHGKRIGQSISYTKHGENIMAGLESLRLMLFKEQFAYREGINFAEIMDHGVVFDLSEVSNNMKPFFYALLLNQVYSIADSFDEMGNDSLRLAVCLEESQLVFGNEDMSAATMDLKQRIQDFRKRGVGLILIAHSIAEISIGVRRLCQTKMYFRQSSDTAKAACSDLLFNSGDEDAIRDKLKSLPQGVCALSYIDIEDTMRIPRKSIFIKASQYIPAVQKAEEPRMTDRHTADTAVTITDSESKPKPHARVAVLYVGEIVYRGETDDSGRAEIHGLLPDRPYKLHVYGAKKKDLKAFRIFGGRSNPIII